MRRSRLLSALAAALLGLWLSAVPMVAHAAAPQFKVLLFTKTASGAYRHDSIPAGVAMFQQMAAANNFQLGQSEDSAVFNDRDPDHLRRGDHVPDLGMVWDNDAQRQALQAYVRSGHGVVAIHNATDMNIEAAVPVVGPGRHGRRAHDRALGDPAGHRQGGRQGAPVHGRAAGPLGAHARSGTTSTRTRGATCTCWSPRTRPPTTRGRTRWAPTTRSPGARNYDGGRFWDTALGHSAPSYAEPDVPHTCSAA